MRVVQLSNTNNWELLYNTNISAVQLPKTTGGFKLVPIPPIIPPLIVESYILAVSITTDIPENAIWKFAGNIYQKINTGLVVGGSQDAVSSRRRALLLDRITLILWERISAPYSLEIVVPKWFPRAGINIWQYIGEDTTEEKIFLQEEFGNINFKLDQIQTALQ
jgi:hypothetical protein